MRKTLAMLALVASGFAFADAPASTQPQPQTQGQQPANKTPVAKPAEIKKIAAKTDEEQTPEKPKMILVADEKAGCCCPTDKKETSGDNKDAQKAPQAQVKTTAPKIALA